MARITKKRKPDPPATTPLAALLAEHLNALRVQDYSEHTVRNRNVHIGFFLDWCAERGLIEPTEITRPVLERYQRHLFHYRKSNGEPLSFRSQHTRLVALRVWFRWMTRQNHILHNPASGDRTAAPGAPPAQTRADHLGSRAGDDAAKSSPILSDCATAPSWKCSTRRESGGWNSST